MPNTTLVNRKSYETKGFRRPEYGTRREGDRMEMPKDYPIEFSYTQDDLENYFDGANPQGTPICQKEHEQLMRQ